MPLMEPAIGDDRQRWAEVGTGLLATTGFPRPSISDLFSGDPNTRKGKMSGNNAFLAREALRRLGDSPETDNLLIKTLIADAPVHAWGSSGILPEFADNPLTIETDRQALKDGLQGSLSIACALVHSGHREILPESLGRALKVADEPSADRWDIECAGELLPNYGSDEQLRQLAKLVQKYQTRDREFYNRLWHSSTSSKNPRITRVLAVVMQDRNVLSDDLRVCDQAVVVLEWATGQHFGAGGKTLAERDEAVSRALAWAKAH